MPDPLKPYRSALERLCGRPPFVLPPPYRQGHFRTDPFPEGLCPQGLELRPKGRSFFLSLTDSALLRAARELSGEDGADLEPSSSFEHTLLMQALRPPEGEPAPRVLTAEERAYLEEPYVPHKLVGVMAQNTPAAAREQHVWSTGSQRIEK